MSFPIGDLRSFSESIMPETVEVIRNTRVSDGEGGYTTTPAAVATYPGRYRTAGARELQIAASLQNAVEGVITVPYDAEIVESDTLRRVEIDVTYNVSGILSTSEDLSADLQVLVRRA